MKEITYPEALKLAREMAAAVNIKGRRDRDLTNGSPDSFYVRYERSDEDDKVTLHVSMDIVPGSLGDARNVLKPRVEVSFPALFRSPKAAVNFIALLTEVNTLAAGIEEMLSKFTIVVTTERL